MKKLRNSKAGNKQKVEDYKTGNDDIIEDEKRVTAALEDEFKKQLENWRAVMQQRDDEIKKQYDNFSSQISQPGIADTFTNSSSNSEMPGQMAFPAMPESQIEIADRVKADYDEDLKNMQEMAKFSMDIDSNLSKGGNDFLKFMQEALQEIMKIFSAASGEGGTGFSDIMGIIGDVLPLATMGLSLPNQGSPSHNIVNIPNNYGRIALNASVNIPLRQLTIGINNENAIMSQGVQ